MMENGNPPERPRSEPEIIPPDRAGGSASQSNWPPYGYTRTQGTQRIYITRMGPFGIALVLLAIAVAAGIGLLFILGAFLIWIPVVAVALVAAAVTGLFRRR
jgi:hypothetical protein